MNGDNGPKRKVRTGLIKLFRDALDEAMEKDPVQHIKDSYHQRLDNEYNTELGINPPQGGLREDPIQRIRDSYDKRLDNEGQPQASISSLEDELRDEPIQRIRDTYDKILNAEYTEPTAVPNAPQKDNNNNAGVDPFRRIKEAYDQMFDDQENKYREEQKQKSEQMPWWKKFF